MLSGTLEEKGKALKEKEVAIRNAEAAKLHEATARGAHKALQARALESRGDAGPGGAVMPAQVDADGEVG